MTKSTQSQDSPHPQPLLQSGKGEEESCCLRLQVSRGWVNRWYVRLFWADGRTVACASGGDLAATLMNLAHQVRGREQEFEQCPFVHQ